MLLQDIARRAKVGIVYDRSLPGLGERVTMHAANLSAGRRRVARARGKAARRARGARVGRSCSCVTSLGPVSCADVVLDSAGGPVPNAFLELGPTPLVAVSASDGSFAFNRVAPGDYTLRVRRLGYHPASSSVRLTDGDVSSRRSSSRSSRRRCRSRRSSCRPDISGSWRNRSARRRRSTAKQIRTRPQLGDDLFRSINRLPGLTSDDFSAGFHVRGSELDQMYVSFDGVQLIEPFHLKDLESALSILDVRSVNGIDLTTGGFTSEYGGRLGSLLSIHSARARTRARRANDVGLSITNLRLQSEGGFAGGRGSWVVAARRGYLDLALKLAGISDSISPVYSDVFAKTSWTFSDRNRRRAARARCGRTVFTTPTSQGVIRSSYGSRYAWLTWDTQPIDAITGQTVVSANGLTWVARRERRRPGESTVSSTITERYSDFAAREDWTADGLRSRRGQVRRRSARDARVVRLRRHSRVVDRDEWRTRSNDSNRRGQSRAEWKLPRRVRRAAGDVRVVAHGRSGCARRSSELYQRCVGQPARQRRRERHADDVASAGGWSIRSVAADLRAAGRRRRHAVRPADVADQRAASIEQRLGDGMSVRVEAYERHAVRERPHYINLRTSTQVFPEFALDRTLLPATSGQAHGVELMARRQATEGFEWTASYALANVTDDVGGLRLPRTYDQRHTAYVDASYHPAGSGWRLSGAWQIHSGWPQAPVTFTWIHWPAQPPQVIMSNDIRPALRARCAAPAVVSPPRSALHA